MSVIKIFAMKTRHVRILLGLLFANVKRDSLATVLNVWTTTNAQTGTVNVTTTQLAQTLLVVTVVTVIPDTREMEDIVKTLTNARKIFVVRIQNAKISPEAINAPVTRAMSKFLLTVVWTVLTSTNAKITHVKKIRLVLISKGLMNVTVTTGISLKEIPVSISMSVSITPAPGKGQNVQIQKALSHALVSMVTEVKALIVWM